MNPRLPTLKSAQVVRALQRAGFEEIRQKGGHKVFADQTRTHIVVVPMHAKDLKRGLLFGIIKSAGLPQEEFLKFL